MSTDIKLSEIQLTKVIQSSRFICNIIIDLDKFGKLLGKKVLTNVTVPFAKDVLPRLVSTIALNAAANAQNKLELRISGKEAVGVGKKLSLFISNEDMDYILRIIYSLED